MTAAQLLVQIGADVSALKAGLLDANRSIEQTASSAGGMGSMFKQAIATALGFAVVQPVLSALGEAFSFVSDAAFGFNARLEQTTISMSVMMKSSSAATDLLNQ